MTTTSKTDVLTSATELYQEYANNGWAARLEKCSGERIDHDTEYDESHSEYRRKRLSRHYENGILIAFTIEYLYHDLRSALSIKMLLVDGARFICP